MIVRFARGRHVVTERVMDAVPRGGEGVLLLGEEMTVWSVAWEVCEGDTEPVAYVVVKRPQDYRRALNGGRDYCNVCENFPCLGNHPPGEVEG